MSTDAARRMHRPLRRHAPSGVAGNLWLAGLGTAVVTAKGSRALASRGRALVDALVEQGRAEAETLGAVADPVRLAAGAWQISIDLRASIDAGIAAGLREMGVPTAAEVQELTAQLERLSAALDAQRTDG